MGLPIQEPNAYNATMDAVVEIVTVSTAEPAKKPVTEGDSDVRAGQVTQERTAIKKHKFQFLRAAQK